ncbi:MAG: FMN-binding protein [Thermomicrobiales bacterium]
MLGKLKKGLLSSSVIALFALYSVQAQNQNHVLPPGQSSIVSEQVSTLVPVPTATSSDPSVSDSQNAPSVTSVPPEPTATSGSLASTTTNNASSGGAFRDGSYTGSPADASWGTVEVVAVISNGKISDVQFLQYPNHRNRSQEINQQAMPMLTQEAIQSQQAQVDVVTGATDTSDAFIQSLASALQQAA